MKFDIVSIIFIVVALLVVFTTGYYIITIYRENIETCSNFRNSGYIIKIDNLNCYVMTKQGNWVFYTDITIMKDDLAIVSNYFNGVID